MVKVRIFKILNRLFDFFSLYSLLCFKRRECLFEGVSGLNLFKPIWWRYFAVLVFVGEKVFKNAMLESYWELIRNPPPFLASFEFLIDCEIWKWQLGKVEKHRIKGNVIFVGELLCLHCMWLVRLREWEVFRSWVLSPSANLFVQYFRIQDKNKNAMSV